jgi:hypothetical protein
VDLRRKEDLLGYAGPFPALGPMCNRMREMNPEENECWRFDLNYISNDWNIVGEVT